MNKIYLFSNLSRGRLAEGVQGDFITRSDPTQFRDGWQYVGDITSIVQDIVGEGGAILRTVGKEAQLKKEFDAQWWHEVEGVEEPTNVNRDRLWDFVVRTMGASRK